MKNYFTFSIKDARVIVHKLNPTSYEFSIDFFKDGKDKFVYSISQDAEPLKTQNVPGRFEAIQKFNYLHQHGYFMS